MARVTVEDCAQVVHSRFELVALAAQRAKAISAGSEITISRDNDKNAVVALREIAAQTVNADLLRESLIQGLQEKVNVDEFGVEVMGDEHAINDELLSEAAAEMKAFHSSNANLSEDDDLFEEEEGGEDVYGGDDVAVDD